MYQNLFPYCPSKFITKIVNFIENDKGEILQITRVRVDHVPQNFGGHNYDLSIAVNGDIAGKQANFLFPILLDKFIEFLIT